MEYEDHPHAYGDKRSYVLLQFPPAGSSPRVWGQVNITLCIDGDTSGYEPFNTLGGWPVRDDIEPAEGSVPYEEMNVSPFDPNSIYTEFMTVRDFWQMLG